MNVTNLVRRQLAQREPHQRHHLHYSARHLPQTNSAANPANQKKQVCRWNQQADREHFAIHYPRPFDAANRGYPMAGERQKNRQVWMVVQVVVAFENRLHRGTNRSGYLVRWIVIVIRQRLQARKALRIHLQLFLPEQNHWLRPVPPSALRMIRFDL